MRALVYVVGEPGAGKSTIMRLLTEARTPHEQTGPPAHIEWHAVGDDGLPDVVTELGRRRDDFGGTDALPMNTQPASVAWLGAADRGLVMGEGDRLGNARFLAAAEGLGYRTLLVWVNTPATLAAERREQRGGGQDPTWVKGRRTKVANLVDGWCGELAEIDGTADPAVVAGQLRERVTEWLR